MILLALCLILLNRVRKERIVKQKKKSEIDGKWWISKQNIKQINSRTWRKCIKEPKKNKKEQRV